MGAKLEASDLCENTLICPGTVVGVKGRLVMVHFDGWEDAYDQYFDIELVCYRSKYFFQFQRYFSSGVV